MSARPSPAETDAEPDDWSRPLLDRQLEVLSELAELGLEMTRAVVAQAKGEAPDPEPAFTGDLAMAFARVSRAARMAVLLQARLIQEIKGETARDEDAEPTQLVVRWLNDDDDTPYYDPADDKRDRDGAAERRETERAERLEREDFLRRPTEELIEEIQRDLGVTSPVAVAMAGGGPLAERSEERVVEGASPTDPPFHGSS